MNICFICSKSENKVTHVLGNNSDCENEILNKLRSVVPEVQWSFDFQICKTCLKDLETAFDFKQLCTKSYFPSKVEDLETANDFNQLCTKSYFPSKSKEEFNDVSDDDVGQLTKDIQCERCGEYFETNSNLLDHIEIKHSAVTSECKDTTDSEDDCNESMSKINKGTTKRSKLSGNILPACELCGTIFKNRYLLKRHRQNVHATEKKFTCEICTKAFVSSVYLNAHKRYHLGIRPHICSFCGKTFITASDLYHHEKIHANKRAYQCEICPKAFNTSSDLHKHKICVHTERKDWKYVCSYCDKRFPLKVNLDSHIKIHTGEKNFSCHLCYRKCINKSILMRHIETHTNALSFRCDICLKGYKYKKSLKEHKSKVHKIGEIISQRNKKFVCHLCQKSYYANNKLEKHLRSHSGEKPFTCPHCHKNFADKSYVKQHLKTMHDIDVDTKY